MCHNLMSEAERTVMAKAGAARDARWDELTQAVDWAVEEGRVLLRMQERCSVDEFNDDSKYSEMLHEAVQVRTPPPTAPPLHYTPPPTPPPLSHPPSPLSRTLSPSNPSPLFLHFPTTRALSGLLRWGRTIMRRAKPTPAVLSDMCRCQDTGVPHL